MSYRLDGYEHENEKLDRATAEVQPPRQRRQTFVSSLTSTAMDMRSSTPACPFSITCSNCLRGMACLILKVACQGDLESDDHHSVEDIAITLGPGLDAGAGDKAALLVMAKQCANG